MRHGTFEYDVNGVAIAYVCRHRALNTVCPETCSVTRQMMCDWANGLPGTYKVRLVKRNELLDGTGGNLIEMFANQ